MNYVDKIAAEVEASIPPGDRPTDRAMELYRLYALLVLTRGEAVTLENIHDAWSVWMTASDPSHKSLVPFGQLDSNTKREDEVFLDAVRAAAELSH